MTAAGGLPRSFRARPRRRPVASLPTRRERDRLAATGTRWSRSRPVATIRRSTFTLSIHALRFPDVPTLPYPVGAPHPAVWAYVVHLRTPKATLGKRAVGRVAARRRVREAARMVLPRHARRGRVYVFSILPRAVVTPVGELIAEIKSALQDAKCWEEEAGEGEVGGGWRPYY
ncbi:hypothetical protein MMPV_007408 [Pyropia vietnamensis]